MSSVVDLTPCLICEQVATVLALPGGPVVEHELAVAYHLPPNDRFPLQYLGRVLLVTRRHVDHLGELTPSEAAAIGVVGRAVAEGLLALSDVSRVHSAVIGLHVPHFHQHLFPRYDWFPLEADWNSLHERPDAPRGGAAEIAAFVDRLRSRTPQLT